MKDNEIIAEFMEVDFSLPYMWRPGATMEMRVEFLNYHESWNWIMPVVEKIESIYIKKHGYFGVYINSNSCTIQGTKFRPGEANAYYSNYVLETKLKSTYKAVIEFIKWYNEQ